MDHLCDRNFDFIVCGVGTTGCVVAARLADKRKARVLLIRVGSDGSKADCESRG
nr:GMC family oxidoreductase N-terminal domain-containing protein [Pseudomonas putida]